MTASGASSPRDGASCSSKASCRSAGAGSTALCLWHRPFVRGGDPGSRHHATPEKCGRRSTPRSHGRPGRSCRRSTLGLLLVEERLAEQGDRVTAVSPGGRQCGLRSMARSTACSTALPTSSASACQSSGGSDGARPRSRRGHRGCVSAASTSPCGTSGPRVSQPGRLGVVRGSSFSSDMGAPPCESPLSIRIDARHKRPSRAGLWPCHRLTR